MDMLKKSLVPTIITSPMYCVDGSNRRIIEKHTVRNRGFSNVKIGVGESNVENIPNVKITLLPRQVVLTTYFITSPKDKLNIYFSHFFDVRVHSVKDG